MHIAALHLRKEFPMFRQRLYVLAGMLLILAAGMTHITPAAAIGATQAAPAAVASRQNCVSHRHIDRWNNAAQLEAQGFNRELFGDQGSMRFRGEFLALDVASDPNSSTYTASRITEVDSAQPVEARVKCWQPTARQDVVVTFTVRFDQATVQSGMTENLFLWNAPLPAPGTSGAMWPFTVAGVTRSNGSYRAVVAEDLNLTTFTGFVQEVAMPTWLNAAAWHDVKTTVSQTHVRVEVAQGEHEYTTVLDAALPHAPEPMAFEFSIDNEAFPGFYVPISSPDGLDVDKLDIRLVRSH
jgi:hypothetical protein